jgi:hypothetical protein
MKKIIFIVCILCILVTTGYQISAQSLSPQVVASSGGYYTNTSGSLSFTVGETNIQTLSSPNHLLTQGFQQPLEINLLNVKAFLEGYYVGAGMMNDVLYNQGVYPNPSTVADSVTVELHDATAPYALTFLTKLPMEQNGSITIKGLGVVGQSYYIVLKHRNTVETWSAQPVVMNTITNYDFSTSNTQAFGGNQREMEPGVFALYSGDVNQDWSIDAFDYLLLDPDIIAGAFGYIDTDLTGDGVVDAFDYIVLDGNLTNGVGAVMP